MKHASKLIIFVVLIGFSTCSSTSKYSMVEMFHDKPKIPKMIPRSQIGPHPRGVLANHEVKGILIMDSGADYRGETSLTYMTNLVESYMTNKNSNDVPCHFFIDSEGIIYGGRSIISPATIYEGDPYTLRRSKTTEEELLYARLARKTKPMLNLYGFIVIMVLGDYDQELANRDQEKSLFQLCAYLCHQNEIPISNIVGLRTVYPDTNNPGFYLNNYLQSSILSDNIPPPPPRHRFMIPPNEVNEE